MSFLPRRRRQICRSARTRNCFVIVGDATPLHFFDANTRAMLHYDAEALYNVLFDVVTPRLRSRRC